MDEFQTLRDRCARRTDLDQARLAEELELIESAGLVETFYDLLQQGQTGSENHVNSLVAYALGITSAPPTGPFQPRTRYVNARVSMPDIDIDFPDDRRHEMIEYTVRRYGADKCAAIITFGTLGARAAVRDVGRALEVPLSEVDRVARMVPNVPGKPVKLSKLLHDDATAEEWPAEAAEIRQAYRADPVVQNLLDTAVMLEGQTRHASTHAAGVVISDKPIVEYAPLHRPTKGNDSGPIQQVVQFDMNIVESIGLLKVDFLGLATLSVMRRACEHIEQRHGRRLDLSTIPYERCPDDPAADADVLAAYRLLQDGHTAGVFQVEGQGLRRTLTEMRPDQFEHVIAAISLYRPGPMEYIPAYIRRMHGAEKVSYHHSSLKPILDNTYGILVYQEQIMRVASDLGGYSPGEADLMRRAVSKKKAKDIEYHKGIFVEGATKRGIDRETAEKIYGDIEFFARYGFNKCLPGDVEVVDAATGRLMRIGDLYHGKATLHETITCKIDTLTLQAGAVARAMFNGVKPVFKLTTALGRTIEATANHPFYTFDGWRLLAELGEGDQIAVPRQIPVEGQQRWPEHEVIALAQQVAQGAVADLPTEVFQLNKQQVALLLRHVWAEQSGSDPGSTLRTPSLRLARQLQHLLLRLGILSVVVEHHHLLAGPPTGIVVLLDEQGEAALDPASSLSTLTVAAPGQPSAVQRQLLSMLGEAPAPPRSSPRESVQRDLYWDRIVRIEYVGEKPTYDLEVPGAHNFVANDILVHNSHAADYAVITVQTAYLKAHYPVEYLCALLEVEFDDTNKVPTFLSECRRLNIDVLPPDINCSGARFTIELNPNPIKQQLPESDYRRWAIRVGMGAIKNVGLGAVEAILAEREQNGPFRSLDDFCERVDLRQLNRRVLECLAKVGCFDELVRPVAPQAPRETVLAVIDRMIGVSGQIHEAAEVGQLSMFDMLAASSSHVVKSSVLRPLPDVGQVLPKQRLLDEKELLGLYISDHPLQQVTKEVGGRITHYCSELGADEVGQSVVIAGLLAGLRTITTKKGDRMAFAKLEDLQGEIEVVLFPRTYEAARELLELDNILLVRGRVEARNESLSVLADDVQRYEVQPLTLDGSGAVIQAVESDVPAAEESSLLDGMEHRLTLTLQRTEDPQSDVARLHCIVEALRAHEGSDRVLLQCVLPNGQVARLQFLELTTRWNAHLRESLLRYGAELQVEDVTPDPRARFRRSA